MNESVAAPPDATSVATLMFSIVTVAELRRPVSSKTADVLDKIGKYATTTLKLPKKDPTH